MASIPTTQRALQFSAPTPFSTFQNTSSAPVPSFPSNTSGPATLVRILSTSLNPVDYKLASLPLGIPRLAIGPSPMIPATDFVGRVARTTDPTLAVDDLVFGKLSGPSVAGTCAEYSLVKGTSITKVPAGWAATGRSIDEFAGVGVCALTALMALRRADVPWSKTQGRERGGKIFINGGSGGVGTFAVQLAKQLLGCTAVVASCSGANVALVKELGADEVIDYRSAKGGVAGALKDWAAANGGQQFDAIIDLVGADMDIYWQAHHYLKANGGMYVQIGAGMDLGGMWALSKVALWPGFLGGGKRAWGFESLQSSKKEDLDLIAKLMVEGKVRCVIDDENVFDLADGRKAYEKLHTGRVRGKVIVKVAEN